ncbi:LamG-like jellyroll fold domain-containing protein [Chitinophaga solisilvae]|uniref:Ig-like domain-containing protein n=1 Tax=Chitinophaga solisilvae TaxID=1233460 RepID=UPI00136823BB|nr:LamG-like jellyroll fold domain-containing protein [Chitinophaga solisilvae]
MKPLSLRSTALLLCWLLSVLALPVQSYGQKTYATIQTNKVNGLCILCGVSNPDNAVNSNLNDYSTFVINVGLLGVSVEQTLIFPASANAGCDSLVVGIGSSNPVLSASLFGGITVETFNGSISNNDATVVYSGVLRLLDNNTRAEVTLKPAAKFDRVKVSLQSTLVGLLNSFRLYYAYRKSLAPPAPVVNSPVTICAGDTATLTASGPGIRWYSSAAGGTLLGSGSPFKVSPAATTVYYAEADNGGCLSQRTPDTVTVVSRPDIPTLAEDTVSVCYGDSVVLQAIAPANVTFRWYLTATGGSPEISAPRVVIHNLPLSATFYVDALNSNGCVSAARQPVTVIVKPLPAIAVLIPPLGVACQPANIPIANHQDNVVYQVRLKYADGLSVQDTSFLQYGDTIHAPALNNVLNARADVYVKTISTLNGCTSITIRDSFTVSRKLPAPSAPDTIIIHPGDSVNLTASGSGNIRWYNASTGGTLLYAGNPYKVAPSASTYYYAGLESNGCESLTRKAVYVSVISCATPPSGALAIYRFSGNLDDESGNGHNGSLATGGVPFVQDNVCNRAGVFSSAFVAITSGVNASSILPRQALTVSYWVKKFSSGNFPMVVNGALQDNLSNEYGFAVGHRNNSLQFYLRGSNNSSAFYLTGPQTVLNNQWYHVVATYDNTTMKLYLNGTLYSSSTNQSGNILYQGLSTDFFGLGAYVDQDEFYPIDARIDEVYIYGRALNATEISDFYHSYFLTSNPADRAAAAVSPATEKVPVQPSVHHRTPTEKLLVYPNPTDGIIQLQLKEDLRGSIAIVNSLDGKPVFRTMLNSNTIHLPSSITAGAYIIQVRTLSGKTLTTTIILKR